jgi:DNA segregation ATPase FtsK/SpoIIIE, S-DNA-T family
MRFTIMSAPPAPDSANLRALPAADSQTEVRLGESTAPAYVDLSDGRAQRKPLVPPHLRDGDGLAGLRRGIRRHLRNKAAGHAHSAAWHFTRGTLFVILARAVVGVFRITGRILAWWHATDLYKLEHEAAADGLLADHLRIHRQGRDTRTARGIILAVGAFIVLVVVVVVVKFAPWLLAVAAVAAIPVLARAGRPAGKPAFPSATLPPSVQPPTQDVITRALGSLGITGIDKWLREERPLVFPSPVREDGPGWRAEVDLPFGVTAEMVIERRQQLASGLRRPLGAVWPEPVSSEHAGRLELWVGRQDVARARQAPWPLLRSGQADVFARLPFGTDVRGRTVTVPVMYHNWLIGALPGQGKTAAVRVLAAGCALDPLCELWIHELKGSGDLDPLQRVSHRFASGVDDGSIGYAAESLRLLRAELEQRTERLKALPREICPDKRVTREIASRRSLKLHPVCCVVDEMQNLMGSDRYGKSAADDAQFVIRIGRAFGVFLILATQRPDRASLPTGISANVSQRFALKLMDQPTNDMVLGTGAYKAGIKATTFRPEIDAGIGFQIGAGPAPQVVRTFYLDQDPTERVASRARALREAAGTLSGDALGGIGDTPRDVLADLAAVFGGSAALQWPEAAARLASRFPGRWADAGAEAVSAECRALGVPSVSVRAGGQVARGCRLADITAALERS